MPMLAELASLDRKSAGRVLVATIAANVDDIGSPRPARPGASCRGRSGRRVAPHLVDGEITALRADLEDALATLDKLRARLDHALRKLN